MNSNKRQTLFFSLDQIIDSGLVFIFIAIGGNLLDKSDMANVVLFQSVALVSVLFCSCFTTQYLLLRYKKQSSLFWLKLFLFFCIITMLIVSLWFQSAEILFLFFVGISSEYIKRYCFYINNSCLSFFSTIITAFIFFVFILMCWLNFMRINSTIYIYIYSGAKLIPLTIICCFLFIKTKFNSDGEYEMPSLWYAITDSLRFGGVFSVITIIYWITNQGFFIFFHDRMPAAELVEIRVTQNVFGVVTMLIALYDSMFLKKNIENKNKIFDWRSYFKFLVISIVLITFNFILLYILSITIYKHLDVF
ncbi:O149 family O-antigen flippase, partial [Escherichia coli]|nr:O149 family O-antigen flippase [Escherichia coli]